MKKLPDGWKFVKLSDIANISAGGTPRRNVQEYWNNGVIPWLKISDLKKTYINYAEEKITQKGLDDSSAKIFPKGTIVYSIFATLGAMGILEISAATNQAIAGIIPNNSLIETKYLYHCLQSEKNNILEKKSHATQDNINLTILRNHEIPLPPLPTQKKIAAVLEKAEKLRDWRKEADGLTDALLKSTFLEMFGDPEKNPKGWNMVMFGKVVEASMNGFGRRSEENLEKKPIVLRIQDIQNGYIDISSPRRISMSLEEFQKYKLKENDFLYVRVNGTLKLVGKSAIVPEIQENVTFSDHIVRIRFNQKMVCSLYVHFLTQTQYFRSNLYSKVVTTAGQNSLGFNRLSQILIPLPPLTLQQKFASTVQQVEQIRQHQEQSTQQIDHFFNVMMQKAFNGGVT